MKANGHIGAKTFLFLSRNYQEFDVWKMWILWKMGFWNCEFCEKWDFEIVNFFEKCDFDNVPIQNIYLDACIKNVNFVKNGILKKYDFFR